MLEQRTVLVDDVLERGLQQRVRITARSRGPQYDRTPTRSRSSTRISKGRIREQGLAVRVGLRTNGGGEGSLAGI